MVSLAEGALHIVVVAGDTFVGWGTVALTAVTLGLLIAAVFAGINGASGVKEQIRSSAQGVQAQVKASADGVKEQVEAQRNIEAERAKAERKLEAQRRVFDLQKWLNTREFVEMSAMLVDIVGRFRADPAAAESEWTKNMSNKDRMIAIAVLNFYELVASEYNANLLDRTTANNTLAYAALEMWAYTEPFVAYLRFQNADDTFYDEWEYFQSNYGVAIREAAALSVQARGSTSTH